MRRLDLNNGILLARAQPAGDTVALPKPTAGNAGALGCFRLRLLEDCHRRPLV